MEFLLGGLAACGAGFFTNPLEVVKTRLQLQGELQVKGHYQVHYKNVFHAFYAIAKSDGVLALQKGLVPALWYQFCMNGCRLGVFQCFKNLGLVNDSKGKFSFGRSVVAGATAGCMGAVLGSPIYMVKTQLQARAAHEIAVGYQHQYDSMRKAFREIFKEHGLRGLWRGVSAAVIRVMIGSATQLSTFSQAGQVINDLKIFEENSVLSALAASTLSGIAVVICMTPFDVVSTRLYNQGVNCKGKGLYYDGFIDCFVKILTKEGFWGFYKGWAASLFRLGPHTVLTLVFWDRIRYFIVIKADENEM